MTEDATRPKQRVNRWILEPLYSGPMLIAALVTFSAVLVLGTEAAGEGNPACVTLLIMTAVIGFTILAFAVKRPRKPAQSDNS